MIKGKKIITLVIAITMLMSAIVIINEITNNKIVEKASALPIGISIWEWDTSTDYNFVNTSTEDLYYGNTLTILFNQSQLNSIGASDYYLYYPIYTRESGASGYEYNISWTKWDTGTYDKLDSNGRAVSCNLDVAGLWFVSDQFAIYRTNMTNQSVRDSSGGWHRIVGMFWVNHTTPYTIGVSPDTVYYGANESTTISVYESDGSLTTRDVWVDIRKDDTSGPYDDKVIARKLISDGSGQWVISGTDMYTYTNSKGAGTYNIHAYENVGSKSAGDFAYGSAADSTGYNTSFGNTTAGQGWNSLTILNSTSLSTHPTWEATYYHATCGPFDPPEYQHEDIVNLTVASGVPTIVVTNDSQYWNDTVGEVNISLEDYDLNDFTASSFTVALWNRTNKPTKPGAQPINSNYYNVSYATKYVKITPNAAGVKPNRWGWNESKAGDNGIWARKGRVYVTLYYDSVGNSTKEWNVTAEFDLVSAQNVFKWVNDGSNTVTGDDSGDITDGVLGKVPRASEVPLWISFRIINSDYNYFGDTSNSGDCTTVKMCAENITVSGDTFFTGTVDTLPGYATGWFGGNYSNAWSIPVIPMMSTGGGTITIRATAWNKTIEGTLKIGDDTYWTDGSVVSVSPNSFGIDVQDQILTIDVYDAQGNANPYATVHLYWMMNGRPAANNPLTPSAGITADANGKYSWNFNLTQQRENQTALFGAGNIMAPRNLSVYVVATNAGYGWARIDMLQQNDFEVMLSHDTWLAGMVYNDFTVATEIYGTNDTPSTETTDRGNFYVKIYDEHGEDVTASFDGSGTMVAADLNNPPTDYIFDEGGTGFDGVYCTTPGTYTFYAYNNTHDSTGHNGTLVVEAATVTCDKNPFYWMADDNISATFTITWGTANLTGYVRIDNISAETHTDGNFNRTWVNCSFDGDSDTTDPTNNDSIEVDYTDVNNGVVTIHDITANFLKGGKALANITVWFKPLNADDEEGAYARCIADPLIQVRVPEVTPDKMYIPLATTSVTITVTGRETAGVAEKLGDVYVRAHGVGIDQNGTSTASGTDKGKVKFTLNPQTTGEISLDVGEEGRTVDTVITVTGWVLDVSVSPTSVDEGDSFTVTVTREDSDPVVYVEGATVSISGIGSAPTDANGQATFNAPEVTSDRDFTIQVDGKSVGYADDPSIVQVRVINVPALDVAVDDEVEGCKNFEIAVSNRDTGVGVVGASVTFNGDTKTTKAGGVVTFKAPKTEGTYTITASYGTFKDGTADVTVTECDEGTPGFELLTLIAAIGVAFILLRRRRKK